jgi:hypothetical protein
MTQYVCLYADTLEVHHYQDFQDHEKLPVDLPHKNLIWRRVVEVHIPFDPETEEESDTSLEVTDSHCFIHHTIGTKIFPEPETPAQHQSRKLRAIQSACFATDRVPQTMLLFELYNTVRTLQGLEPLTLNDFKKELQKYAA